MYICICIYILLIILNYMIMIMNIRVNNYIHICVHNMQNVPIYILIIYEHE
jgi:hypothetical protein